MRIVGFFICFQEKNVLFWSTKKVYDGVLGWIFLLLIGGILSTLFKKADSLTVTQSPRIDTHDHLQ